jgi:hypothetical protein
MDWIAQSTSGAWITAGEIVIDGAANSLIFSIPLLASASGVSDASLSSTNPSWSATLAEADDTFNILSFEYEFVSGSGGVLSAHFDGEIVFTAYQDQLPPGPLSATITLGPSYLAGSYSLAFRLDSGGITPTEVKVSGVQFEAPTAVEFVPAMSGFFTVLLVVGVMFVGCVATWEHRKLKLRFPWVR